MVEVLELGKDFVRARVESRSQPGTFHTVEVTRYGAVCDCLGVLSMRKKDLCVHAENVLAFLKQNHGLTFALSERKINTAHLVPTGAFIDAFGGLLAGEPTLFYGPDGSGKTLSTLTVIARYSNIQSGRIVYVNTETGDPQNAAR
jgi:ABC-type multidrug transport system fused ATPase/permease subunit